MADDEEIIEEEIITPEDEGFSPVILPMQAVDDPSEAGWWEDDPEDPTGYYKIPTSDTEIDARKNYYSWVSDERIAPRYRNAGESGTENSDTTERMRKLLSIDKIVKLNLIVGAAYVQTNAYDAGLILGTWSDTDHDMPYRLKEYKSLDEVAAEYAATTDEYKAAKAYFDQNPAPIRVYIGLIDLTATTAETVAVGLEACLEASNDFYGVYVCGTQTADTLKAAAALLDSYGRGMLFYTVSGTVSDATAATSAFVKIAESTAASRGFGIYTTEAAAAPAAMGRACGLNHALFDQAFTLCYKDLAGITPVAMTEDDVDDIKEVYGNVYVSRGWKHNLLEQGTTGSGLRYDEVMYLDALKFDIQEALVDLMASNVARLPQNDSTSAQFINAVSGVLESFVSRGVIATGIWQGDPVGSLKTGDTLDKGYYIHVESFNTQSREDRDAHKAMPLTVCLCLSGSVESVEITVYAQR